MLVQSPPDFQSSLAELSEASELALTLCEESASFNIIESFIQSAYTRVYLQYITLNQDLDG